MSRLWEEAQRHLAWGVNSPVRSFRAVGREPIFMERSFGPFLYDAEGREYVDYCLSWGAVLLGHAEQSVSAAVAAQAARGTSFGTATPYETALARLVKDAFPSIQKLRFTSSGTEAVMSAIRLARGVTGRPRILKFEGGYHGHADSLLVKAGSGAVTHGSPDSAGVPEPLAALTATLPYNDSAAATAFLRANRDVACVLVEPVAGNMGVVPPKPGFLQTLRRETRRSGALLLFDEVITGFRVARGGAQALYGVEPDLTTLGKILGGGLPVGAFGGRSEWMDALSPGGPVYQAGTLSGNPLSMAAGRAVLSKLEPSVYRTLEAAARDFTRDALKLLRRKKLPVTVQRVGSMFTFFFRNGPASDFDAVRRSDTRLFARFFGHLVKEGVYWPPSAFEASFLSAAHGPSEIRRTLRAFEKF